jgi:hypothetical protein
MNLERSMRLMHWLPGAGMGRYTRLLPHSKGLSIGI